MKRLLILFNIIGSETGIIKSDTTVSKAVKVVPDSLETQPLFLSIDDTMVEKFAKKFELCSKLFDHAAHNGSNYLNDHCMVSILLSFPFLKNGQIQYLSVPLGYRLWDKEKSKLEIATEMIRQTMGMIGSSRQLFLLCDSWYPKADVAELINEFGNLDILCNARVDTAMYELPPAPTGKRGRPRKYGEENINFLPLSCYLLRWNLEVSYYEGKTFWSLEEYRIRSREGIVRLINLLAVSYSAMTLLSL